MADVFVSYASEDRKRIVPIVEAIEQAGFTVWWDRRIGLGASFDREIERELDAAACVVVIWSEHSIESDWVRNEAQEGLDRGVLLPILIDDIRPPLAFRRAQSAQLLGRVSDDESNRVISSIESIVTGSTTSGPGWNESHSSRMNRWPQYLSGLAAAVILILASYWWIGRDDSVTDDRPTGVYAESSLAVFPFTNLSKDPDMAFFSDGITREISSKLARNANIVVRQPPSSLELKKTELNLPEIGQQLAVTHVLEGGVQRSGELVRITVQLINVNTEQTIWSDQFNLEMKDVFEAQDEITRQIFNALNLQLTVRPMVKYSVGTEAYDAFLRGLYHSRTGEAELAEEWYRKSAELDPNNPDLWAERARHLVFPIAMGMTPKTGAFSERLNDYVERALAIDPSHWANAFRARAMFLDDRQYQRAIDLLVKTVVDHPNSWDTLMYLTFVIGAVDRKSDAHYRAARRYSLLSNDFSTEQLMLVDSCRLVEARQSIASNPNWASTYHAARLAAIEGDQEGLESYINNPSPLLPAFFTGFFTALQPYIKGDFEQARKIISSEKRVDGYQPFLLKVYIALIERDLEAAVENYAKAVNAAEPPAMWWHHNNCFLNQVFPEFVAYPAYQQVLKGIGLDEESMAKIEIPEIPF